MAKKTERRLKIGARARKAQRLRNAAENRQKKAIEKMERFYQRQAQMDEIKFAITERRKQVLREEKIRRDKWRAQITTERAITPGPGECVCVCCLLCYMCPSRLCRGRCRPVRMQHEYACPDRR